MNYNNYVVFDLETTGKYADRCEIVEIAAVAINGRTLEPFQNAAFESYICPPEFDKLLEEKEVQEAFAITKIDVEEVKKAPSPKVVWPQFVAWVNKFNSKKDEWNSPVAVGQNIEKFDIIIANRYNKAYGPKREDTILFNTFKCVDLIKVLYLWFENTNDLKNFKNETIREFTGYADKGAHRAMNDVQFASALFTKFMKLHRHLYPKIAFKNCFANTKEKE